MLFWLRLRYWLSCRHQGNIMADLTQLAAISAKIAADIDTKLAADQAALAAKDATIADLTAQLAAANTDQAGVDAAVASLTSADAKLA
jgi:hypothetical protein